jgi:hypothetical protein
MLRTPGPDPGRLHEQDAQAAIGAARYLTGDGAVSGRDQPAPSKPSGELATPGEHIAGADRRHRRDRLGTNPVRQGP